MSYLSAVTFPPLSQGFLPYWIMFASSASIYNAIQNYLVQWQTKEVYGGKPEEVTPLACRLFGTYTFYSAMVRTYAAFNISNPIMYNLAALAFATSGLHFLMEFLFFGTVKLNRASLGPMMIPTGSLIWMYLQRDYYLGL